MAALTIEDAYRKWGDDLVRYATALVGPADAPDLVSEAFTSVLARGDSAWEGVLQPRGYLYRAVTNAARMSARGDARRRARELRWPDGAVTGELLADPGVRRTLDHLSVQQRAVVYLTYWQDPPATAKPTTPGDAYTSPFGGLPSSRWWMLLAIRVRVGSAAP